MGGQRIGPSIDLLSARFGVLGVYVNGRTREKEAALTGQPAPAAIDSLIKAATRKPHR